LVVVGDGGAVTPGVGDAGAAIVGLAGWHLSCGISA
jgi:hypothetical protein